MTLKNPLLNKLSYFFRITLLRVLLDTQTQIKQSQLLMVAASQAYVTILSIIPALALSFAVFQAFGGMQKLNSIIVPLILSNLAEGTSDEVVALLHKFIDNTHAAAIGVGGLVGLIFTTMSMLSNAEKAINQVWQTRITRGFLQRIATYWLFITLGPLALSIVIGFATSSSLPLMRFFPNGTGMFLISIGLFFCIYKWVPQAKVKSTYALISAVLTASCWNLARLGYSLYTEKVVTYNVVYGSLGAVPILLLWIYIIWIIILTGAAFTAALQKRAG